MAMADVFVILSCCQFEKNGYQNRFKIRGKWITKPVCGKQEMIRYKDYVDGQGVFEYNMRWINLIRDTLGIKTELCYDRIEFKKQPTKTTKIIDLVKRFGGDSYVTNPDAFKKYLDISEFEGSGVSICECIVPRHLQISIFEAIEKYGFEGLKKQLPRG
jgi:hypothetical protein